MITLDIKTIIIKKNDITIYYFLWNVQNCKYDSSEICENWHGKIKCNLTQLIQVKIQNFIAIYSIELPQQTN